MAPERKTPKVAVIGAGISGVVSAAYLRTAGINVTVFERAKVSGGVWYFLLAPRQKSKLQLTSSQGLR